MTEKAWNMIQRVELAMIHRTRKEQARNIFGGIPYGTTTSCFGNIFFDTDHGLFQLCIEHASTQMDSCINHQGIHPVHELEIQQMAE